MEFERLSKKFIKAKTLGYLIFLLLVLSFSAVLFFTVAKGTQAETPYIIVSLSISILLFLITVFIPRISYRRWQYRITPDRVEIKVGVIVKRYTTIPISRIQHVTLSSGPIDRWLELSAVHIFTAGGDHAIPELENDVAEKISLFLKEQVNQKLNHSASQSSFNKSI